MIYPESLKCGDRIAILSPASHIDPKIVDDACEVLAQWGFAPVVSPHCKGVCGT
ncbi:MAG: hypothetical protein RR868_00315 [Muribaculaceae bacterium]